MQLRFFFLFCLNIICYSLLAQNCLSGRVANSENKPLAFVSVAVYRDSVFVSGTLTANDGGFCISTGSLAGGAYSIRLSLVGYQPVSQRFTYPGAVFSKLTMQENKQELEAVTVTSRKNLFTKKVDRYILQVEGSYLADGKSALEVLRQSPSVWVDGNGSIRIKGNEPVTVMINDVVQRMSGSDLAEYLGTLRSEDIATIEIIPNPPGEYEASSAGGIVHIILKKGRRDGINGSVYAQYRQQSTLPYISVGGSLDFNSGRFYLSAGASANIDKSRYGGYTNTIYPDGSALYSPGRRINNNTRAQYRLAMTYDFCARHSLTLQSTGSTAALLQKFITDIEFQQPPIILTGHAQTDWTRHPGLGSSTFIYSAKIDTLGSSFKVIADVTTSNKTETNIMVSAYSDQAKNSNRRTATPSGTTIYNIQADLTQILPRKITFKTGAKYVGTDRHNRIITDNFRQNNWQEDPAAGNDFMYTEKLLMGYISAEKNFNATQVKASLRGEQTFSRGRSLISYETISKNYFGLFPSLFINHTLNEELGHSISINYARRIKRPGYNDLNPYRLQLHDYTILTGNPNLLPQYTHSIEAGYTLFRNYSVSGYIQSAQNYIAQTATTVNDNIIAYQSKNFRNSKELGVTLNALTKIRPFWNMTTSVLFYHVRAELMPVIKQTSFSLKSGHNISIPKLVDLDLYAEYNSPYLDANAKRAPLFYMDLGLTKRIGVHKLRFYLTDVFNTVREKDITRYNNTVIDFYQKRTTRTFSFSFTYNFRKGKTFTQKKAEQTNAEEKTRL